MRLNRSTRLGLLLFGVGVVILCWLAGRRMGSAPPAPPAGAATPAVQTVAMVNPNVVAVARVDIPPRSIITPDMIEMMALPSGQHVMPGSPYANNMGQVEGFITSHLIPHGSKINRGADLIGHITQVGVSGALNPGMRALSIAIPSRPTLHDLVKVGDTVDIIASFDGQETRTLVTNTRVLAVDVYGAEYPPTSLAQRGEYKAPPEKTAAPAAPANGAPAAVGPDGQPVPAPTATPSSPAPPKPEASLTLEVTPKQAVAIALAASSGGVLDYTLRPRVAPAAAGSAAASAAPVEEIHEALIKPQLAPYAVKIKAGGGNAKAAAPAAAAGRGSSRGGYASTLLPDGFGQAVPPAPVPQLAPGPQTYDIPIYGDGKIVRHDTVLKPQS